MGLADQPRISTAERRQRAKPKRQSSQKASETILDAAATVMGRNGDKKFTLSEIARRLNISPSTIHHYFGSKEVLVAAVKARLNYPHHQNPCLAREMGTP
jgi:AcrR family transcriptional regulator